LNSKTIEVINTNGGLTRVYAKRFTDQNLQEFIQDYIRRKSDDDEYDQYTSLFCTTISTIKSNKDCPKEFLHKIDKEERYLK